MEISCDQKDGKTIVHIRGEVDMHKSPELEKVLDELTQKKTNEIIVNLSQTFYLDSSGIATLVECLRKVRAYDGKFYLIELNEKIKPIFEIMRLEKVFAIHSSLSDIS